MTNASAAGGVLHFYETLAMAFEEAKVAFHIHVNNDLSRPFSMAPIAPESCL